MNKLGYEEHNHNKLEFEQNKYINTLYSIVDKLEQRIATLEKVLASHAKCIGEMREEDIKTWTTKYFW